jgi:hypothetical protein
MATKKQTAKKPRSESDLAIEDVLKALDLGDKQFFKNLPEESKKKIAIHEVLLRWMSSVGSSTINFEEARQQGRKKGDGKGPWPSFTSDSTYTETYLLTTNAINEMLGYHDLYKHPELEWLLLSLVGIGATQEHQWISNSPKSVTPKIDAMLYGKYPLANEHEITVLKQLGGKDMVVQLAHDFGMTDKEIAAIKLEAKKLNG